MKRERRNHNHSGIHHSPPMTDPYGNPEKSMEKPAGTLPPQSQGTCIDPSSPQTVRCGHLRSTPRPHRLCRPLLSPKGRGGLLTGMLVLGQQSPLTLPRGGKGSTPPDLGGQGRQAVSKPPPTLSLPRRRRRRSLLTPTILPRWRGGLHQTIPLWRMEGTHPPPSLLQDGRSSSLPALAKACMV